MYIIKVTDSNWDSHESYILFNAVFTKKETAERDLLMYLKNEESLVLVTFDEYLKVDDEMLENYCYMRENSYNHHYDNGGQVSYEIIELELM